MLWTLDHLLLVTAAAVAAAIVLVLCILLGMTRIYPHQETRAAFGAAVVGIAVTVLFSVVLNNLYAMKRDRDSRLRNLRDQHYTQLKPVLHTESSKLAEIADQITKSAHITRVDQYENTQVDPSAMLWPDVMSRGLRNHFADYDSSKHTLLSQIEDQDQEFREAVAIAGKQISRATGVEAYWRDVDAMSYVEKCVGRGNGVKLNVTQGGFSFEYWGVSMGSSGGGATPPRPSPDQVGAFRGFQSLKPNENLASHCRSLKTRAEAIRNSALQLSKESQLLSESTILRGMCEFMTSDNLSD